ncbi:MAG: hypothetical protein IPO85_10940 [Saprospiraceae bacterium]|uniref:Uncharacterized protein n=1 Tax=Candidatus Defluviibacterium haderslevense TaxID=2981993 RepID=A0A9D7S9R9_9BACT|nr:hypothetical protein [Candidatus Defluviibacterium haderslevense]
MKTLFSSLRTPYLLNLIVSFFPIFGFSQTKPTPNVDIQFSTSFSSLKHFNADNKMYYVIDSSQSFNSNSFYKNNLVTPTKMPFFCKLEHNAFKKTNVKMSFRLGSLDYSNYLEYSQFKNEKYFIK